ncbi:MAG: TVP38/TMEM64 family protein [Verrucomicrobiota bacterium]
MTPAPANRNDRRPWLGLAVPAVVLSLLLFTDWRSGLQSILKQVESFGIWAPVVFVLLYVLACVLLIPGSILTLGAGALFGVVKGSLIVSLAATLGATAAFLVGRHFARTWVKGKLAAHPKFAAIDQAVSRNGWQTVLLTRLSPAFPFTLLNYACGITHVPLKEYVLASWLGMLPGTVVFVYLGSLAKAGTQMETKTPAQWALLIVGLIATIIVTWLITRRAKQALNTRLAVTDSNQAS